MQHHRLPRTRRPAARQGAVGSTRRLLSALALLAAPAGADTLIEHRITPSAADPGVRQFNDPSIAVIGRHVAPDAPLAIFLTGTGGKPDNARAILGVIAEQGYRVIALEYDDDPAVVQVCPRDPDPDCAAAFRERRLTGTGKGAPGVSNPPAEAIVPRLIAALRALDQAAPGEGWGGYLDDGALRWDRIVVSGLSQGAGMAAFVAKQHAVRRVILFSSPWDFTGADRHPAPWLSQPGATPMARWFAEYNRREKTVPLIQAAYAALRIPPANIRVFDLDLPRGVDPGGPNPYHGITVRDPRYAERWRAMYGQASDPAG